MKRILLMALAATTIFACSKQDEMPNGGDTLNVGLKISQVPITRAAGGASVTTGAQTALTSGVLFFFDGTGNTVLSYTLTAADIATITNNASSQQQLIVIKDVPSTAATVAMIANAAGDYSSTTPATFTTFKAITFGLTNQASMSGASGFADGPTNKQPNAVQGIALLDAAGKGTANTITKDVAGTGYNATASIELTPAVARIELPANGIKVKGSNTTGLTGFNLAGVYINNFDVVSNLAWSNTTATATRNILDWVTQITTYKGTGGAPATLYDELGTPAAITTTGGNVMYAYHVMPSSNIPHIIIAGQDFTGNGETAAKKYWRVDTYTYATAADATANGETGATDVGVFNPAKVYVISDIILGDTFPREEPYDENISVQVTITVLNWTQINITPQPK